jgi:GlpG protein
MIFSGISGVLFGNERRLDCDRVAFCSPSAGLLYNQSATFLMATQEAGRPVNSFSRRIFAVFLWGLSHFLRLRIMRMIGHLKNEASAKTFSGYLASLNIRNLVEPDPEGWAVWIHSEDQIETGQEALAAYAQNPADTKYQVASQTAEAMQRQRQREDAKAAKRMHGRDQILARSNLAPFTLSLIGVTVVVALAVGLNPSPFDLRWLSISNGGTDFLGEVRAGQVWRLITPIFIHFGPLHLLFNMMWLNDLGAMIEKRQGMLKLALLVVVLAIASNLGQYWVDGPFFGGMSGVVYGLFGYVWLRGHCDPASGLALSPTTVWMMLVWYFLCLFNLIGHVANAAHSVGLVVGVLLGGAPMARKFFRG